MNNNHNLFMGTAGGTLLTLATTLDVNNILKTALLAAFGSTVSFMVSLLLRYIVGRIRK